MMKDKYLKESLNTQRLNELASKYGISNYMPGQSFDAHKNKMSAEDYETSQKLLEYYTGQKTLTDDYNFNNEIIENNRQKNIENNRISRELALKYLPEQLKSQGMGGLGVSESSIISMNNNFRNNSNDINSDAELRKDQLLKNYQDDMRGLDSNAITDTKTIREKYQTKFENESAQNLLSAEGILDSKAESLMDSNGKISQSAKKELKEYVENNYKGKLTDYDFEQLKSYVDQYKATTTEEESLATDQHYVLNNYGVDENGLSSAIHIDDAGVTSFGKFSGTGSGKDQDKWVQNVLEATRSGTIKNGDVVDFNRGGGTDKYVYYNGYWYPTYNKITIKRGKDNSVERK